MSITRIVIIEKFICFRMIVYVLLIKKVRFSIVFIQVQDTDTIRIKSLESPQVLSSNDLIVV